MATRTEDPVDRIARMDFYRVARKYVDFNFQVSFGIADFDERRAGCHHSGAFLEDA